jgi:bifunctional non-homologous end joining protein LigD
VARLAEYRRKRKFGSTPEPRGKERAASGSRFVVQEHHARSLHYDLRLEIDGVMKSWAVPKGPSLNPAHKRLAIQTEDHPLEYRTFEGVIPAGQYGAGVMKIWDSGTFEPEGSLSASEQVKRGELKLVFHGKQLHGSFVLVKMRGKKGNEWLLIKHKDEAADQNWKLKEAIHVPTDDKKGARHASSFSAATAPQHLTNEVSSGLVIPAGSRHAAMPDRIQPALATLTERAFSDPDWLFEIKWDGLRTLACIRDGKVRLFSRSNREVTREYPELSQIAANVHARETWLDGEIVVLDAEGRSDFQALQLRFSVQKPSPQLIEKAPVVYYIFDTLYLDGYDLRPCPLLERKMLLKRVLREDLQVRYSDHVVEKGRELYDLAVERKLEGLVAKRISNPYPEGRTSSWLKIKLTVDLDAVIGGWTEPRGSREHFGALLLGLYDGKNLEFIGGVGTGFASLEQRRIWEQLQNFRTENCPFASRPSTREKAHWVKPELVARITFSSWTEARHLRMPRFLGLREDGDRKACTFENQAQTVATQSPATKDDKSVALATKSAAAIERDLTSDAKIEHELTQGSAQNIYIELDGRRLHLTNLNKIYFPEDGYTKRDLLAYYFQIAPIILPFLKDRPLVLRRYPNGIHGKAFFQKDAAEATPEWVETVTIASEHKEKPIRYVVANDRATLMYLTNLGCIDHNPWSSRHVDQEHPDYIFFDLDPTDETPFPTVTKLAKLVLDALARFDLRGFTKTSGASGIHIFLPVEPQYTYAQVRMLVQAIASIVDREHPGLITSERSVAKRPHGRVYVDAHQNSHGQSLASVYSVRAFPHAPVSAPVKPEELTAKIVPEMWTLKSMPDRIKKVGDLWDEFWQARQSLDVLWKHSA